MIVAVIPMGMMQMPVDEVADMVAVRYGGVATIRTMHVVRVVPLAVVGATAVGIRVGDFDHVLIAVVLMRTVQMAIVQIANVIAMFDGDVAAVRAVLMRVIFVNSMCHA